jgi:hypothetical protein
MSEKKGRPLLDLYITHWTEPWEIGDTGLEMIRRQRCVDWSQVRITIVHDGSEPYVQGYFDDHYPCEIRQACIPHGGIARARNWCIDHSEAEWIKWNDFDDTFCSLYALRSILDSLKAAQEYDLLWFDVYAEVDGMRYAKTERDPVVLHGKVFRRSFIQEKGLRFKEDLTWCEDSAFLAVLEMEIDVQRIGKIVTDAPIYAWICRDGSLCNRPEIKFANLKSFFERHCYVQEEFKRRGKINEYHAMTARVLADSYFTLKLAGVTEDMSEHEQAVRKYYQEHRKELLRLTNGLFMQVLDAVNRENQCNITKEAFTEWLRSLRD